MTHIIHLPCRPPASWQTPYTPWDIHPWPVPHRPIWPGPYVPVWPCPGPDLPEEAELKRLQRIHRLWLEQEAIRQREETARREAEALRERLNRLGIPHTALRPLTSPVRPTPSIDDVLSQVNVPPRSKI